MSEEKETHPEKSPSGAHRWMACAGSVVLEADEPNSESDYAAEGTLAHALASHCLEKKIDAQSVLFLNHRGREEIIPSDMRSHVQEYIEYVREEADGHHLLVEQKLDLEWLTGEMGAKGTADAVIISGDGKTIKIIDLKYGAGVFVNAQDNPQIRIYGLAALEQFEMMGDFEHITLGIHQPRMENVDEETLNVKELRAFAEEVRIAVRRVEEARRSNSLAGFLNPGKKQCQFCRARAKCPALASVVVEATAADFDDVSQTKLIDPVDPAKALEKVELIELWIKGVRSKVESDLLAGKKAPGWKLVEGKLGNREWRDEEELVKIAKKAGLTKDEIYETAPRSPAQLEKKIKKTKPAALEKIAECWKRAPGKPSVARATDPRPEYNPMPAEDYEDVSDG